MTKLTDPIRFDDIGEEALAARFREWQELEADLARGLGLSPAVHG